MFPADLGTEKGWISYSRWTLYVGIAWTRNNDSALIKCLKISKRIVSMHV